MEAETTTTTTTTKPCQNQASKNRNSLLMWKGTDKVTIGTLESEKSVRTQDSTGHCRHGGQSQAHCRHGGQSQAHCRHGGQSQAFWLWILHLQYTKRTSHTRKSKSSVPEATAPGYYTCQYVTFPLTKVSKAHQTLAGSPEPNTRYPFLTSHGG